MSEKDTKPKKTETPANTTKPAAKPTAKPTANATTKPTANTTAKPAANTTAKPAATPTAKPAANTTAKPVTNATAKPTANTTAKPAATPTAKPAANPAAKPAANTTAKPVANATTKPAAKPTANTTAKPVANATAKPTTNATAKPVANATAKPTTNATAKPTANTTAKPTAKPAADSTAKPTAKNTQPKKKPAKSNGGSGNVGVATKTKNKKLIAIITSAVAFILIIAIVIGIVVGTKSCNNSTGPVISDNTYGEEDDPGIVVPDDKPLSKDMEILNRVDASDPAIADLIKTAYNYEYPATTQVGYYAQVLDEEVNRVKPVAEIKNESSAFDSEDTGDIFADGAKRYPTYGSTMSHVIGTEPEKVAARTAIILESGYLCAWGTRGANNGGAQTADKYTKIDANGYLYQYKDNQWIHSLNWGETEYTAANYRRLYEHTAANGMYLEGFTRNGVTYEVSDDATRVVKEVTMRSRGYSSYGVTGLYAPAGEVIKVEISGKDMEATGGITVHIGQALYNGQANNIWVSKNQMQRFPYLLNTLVLNKSTTTYDEATDTYTGYVGSFIGGPIYLRNAGVKFTAKISGGLEYLHFILGYTTEGEFNRIKQTSKVPYFDLEVWNYGVLHSGPRYYAETFSYDDLYKAAVLWEKVSSVTTTGSSQGIVFLYDPFVAAGAAVAFPGRSSVNCPASWMPSSLNYNAIVSSGSWGNFHEYHHNFQGYGVGAGGEVTNNGMTLVSYALFTKISSKRGIASYGGQGLGGWNNYTSATWALNDLLSLQRGGHPSNGDQGLAIYATLLHNFGANNYIQAKYTQQANKYGQSYEGYMKAWEEQTHNDMSYFFKDVLKGSIANDTHNTEYTSMFVPVSCVYQTGRSYIYDGEKKYFKTMQPFTISNEPFTVDLNKYDAPNGQYASGSIVIPDGFTYSVKSITEPARGSIEIIDNYKVKYTPAENAKTGDTSGQIIVTLEIKKDDGAFKVDDVDLILEFEVSQELTKFTLERTTYSYTAETKYTDAQLAFESNFAGYEGQPDKHDHSNPTQNANTDIWVYPDTETNRHAYPDAPDYYFASDNKIDVIDGKLYFEEDGKYRVYLRGRLNCALYYSLDGKDYNLGATIKDKSTTALFRPNDPNTYFDVEFDEGNVTVTVNTGNAAPKEYAYTIEANSNNEYLNWLYIKEILVVQSTPNISFIGVGMRQWTEPQYTQEVEYYRDEACKNKVTENEYNAMTDSEREALFTKTYYLNNAGQVVSDEEVMSAKPTPPVVSNKSQPYVNAYRYDYNFPDNSEFTSEYFYTREYTYTYNDPFSERGEFVGAHNCFYQANRTDFRPEYLLDGDKTTAASAAAQANGDDATPWTFTVDLGKEISASCMTLTGCAVRNQNLTPTWLELYVSKTGDADDFVLAYKEEKATVSNSTVTAHFKMQTFRYYKICAKNPSYNAKTPAISDVEFSFAIPDGVTIAPTNENIIFSKNWESQVAESNFGRVYVGNAGDSAIFEFKGTRLAISTCEAYDKKFEVYIDGNKATSLDVIKYDGVYGVTFLSDKLESGNHKVEIRCTGEANIDSFVVFNEE